MDGDQVEQHLASSTWTLSHSTHREVDRIEDRDAYTVLSAISSIDLHRHLVLRSDYWRIAFIYHSGESPEHLMGLIICK